MFNVVKSWRNAKFSLFSLVLAVQNRSEKVFEDKVFSAAGSQGKEIEDFHEGVKISETYVQIIWNCY